MSPMKFTKVIVSLLLFIPFGTAASKIGVLSSPGAVKVRDVELTAEASRSVPLVSGDYLTTSAAEATVRLNDRTVLLIDRSTTIGFERSGRQTVIYVWSGKVQVDIRTSSPELSFCVLGTPVLSDAGTIGVIQIEGQDRIRAVATRGALRVEQESACALGLAKPVGLWGWLTPTKIVILTGGAAAASYFIYDALQEPNQPPPVSPSEPRD